MSTREQEFQLKLAAAAARCTAAFGQERFNQMANSWAMKKTPEQIQEMQREWAESDKPEQFLEVKWSGKERSAKNGILAPDEWTHENIANLSDKDFDRNLRARREARRGQNGRP